MDNRVGLSIRQFTEAWRSICIAAPEASQASLDGMEMIFTRLPIPFFNVVVPQGEIATAESLAGMAKSACEWAAPKQVPWFFVATQEAMGEGVDAEAVLGECGLVPVMALTGMLAAEVAPAAQTPAGLELTEPADDAACAPMLSLNEAAYGMPMPSGAPVFGVHKFWQDHVAVVGKAEGQPVSCTAVMLVDGCHYVGFVATLPGQQRKGYADAVMRHALQLAKQKWGAMETVLHATEAGQPVYTRMGYEVIASHPVFMEKRFLAEH